MTSLLSKEQEIFLRWLDSQSAPVSLATMEKNNAPFYTQQRIEELRKSGLIIHDLGGEHSQIVGIYSISDAGKAALSEIEEKRKEKTEAKAEKKADRKFQARISISSAILGAFAGSLLTLFIEHFSEIVSFLARLFCPT